MWVCVGLGDLVPGYLLECLHLTVDSPRRVTDWIRPFAEFTEERVGEASLRGKKSSNGD